MKSNWERISGSRTMQYAEGSPVIVVATALLRNNENGNYAAQIMLQNVSGWDIVELKIAVYPKDDTQERTDYCEVKTYQNFIAKQGETFGEKVAVVFYNKQLNIKDYDIVIKEVLFADGSREVFENHLLSVVPPREELTAKMGDDLAAEYVRITNEKAKYEPFHYKDLLFCSCGAIYKSTEDRCRNCGGQFVDLLRKTDHNILAQSLEATEKAHNDSVYNEAIGNMGKKDIESLEKALSLLETIPNWNDSAIQVEKCKQLLQEEKENKRLKEERASKQKKIIKIIALVIVVALIVVGSLISHQNARRAEQAKAERISNACNNIMNSSWQDNAHEHRMRQTSFTYFYDYDFDIHLSFNNEKSCTYNVTGTYTRSGHVEGVSKYADSGVATCEFEANDADSQIKITAFSSEDGDEVFSLTARYDESGEITEFTGFYYFASGYGEDWSTKVDF